MDAAEAAARHSDWDAWVEGNRFRMRMGRDWGVARSRPGFPRRRWRDRFEAREFGEDERFERRSGRFIDLPAGFAPAAGVPLSFSRGGAEEVAQADERPPYAAETNGAEPGGETPAVVSERTTEPEVEARSAPTSQPQLPVRPEVQPQAATVAATPPAPATPPVPALPERAPRRPLPPAGSAPAAAKSTAPAAPAQVEAAAPSAPATAEPQAKPAETPSTPASPTIINAPGSSAARVADFEERPEPSLEVKITKPASPTLADAAQPPEAEPAPPAPVVDAITPPAPVPAEPPRAAAEVQAAETAKPEPAPETTVAAVHETGSAERMATSSIPPPTTSAPAVPPGLIAMAAATVLALASLAAFGFWRGAARHRVPIPATRDYASVSLGAPGPQPSATAPSDIETEQNPGPQLGLPPPAAAKVDDTAQPLPMPKTYEEALEVLGVSHDAELQAIKKIVDSLRKTWHPDLARSEFDRIHRERRLQRINVAWDVIARRRSAAA
jgi:hypothetical protein